MFDGVIMYICFLRAGNNIHDLMVSSISKCKPKEEVQMKSKTKRSFIQTNRASER